MFTKGITNRRLLMKRIIWILLGTFLVAGPGYAIGKNEVREIIETEYPGAQITEIEKERYKGKKVYEVDFKHEGENLEAIIGLDGEIIKVHIDD